MLSFLSLSTRINPLFVRLKGELSSLIAWVSSFSRKSDRSLYWPYAILFHNLSVSVGLSEINCISAQADDQFLIKKSLRFSMTLARGSVMCSKSWLMAPALLDLFAVKVAASSSSLVICNLSFEIVLLTTISFPLFCRLLIILCMSFSSCSSGISFVSGSVFDLLSKLLIRSS